MKDNEKATIKNITSVLRQLDKENRNKLLWIMEGMAIATKGVNYDKT